MSWAIALIGMLALFGLILLCCADGKAYDEQVAAMLRKEQGR